MKKAAITAIVIAVISIVLGVITRLMPQPVEVFWLPEGVKPLSFLALADTCLLFAVALILLELSKICKK